MIHCGVVLKATVWTSYGATVEQESCQLLPTYVKSDSIVKNIHDFIISMTS